MALTILIYGISEAATLYIHYTSALRGWLVWSLHRTEENACTRPGMDAVCTAAVHNTFVCFFKSSLLLFWYEQNSSSQGFVIVVVFLLLLFSFVCSFLVVLSKLCNALLCNVRINWKYTAYSHFGVGDGLTVLQIWGATRPHLASFVSVISSSSLLPTPSELWQSPLSSMGISDWIGDFPKTDNTKYSLC